MFPDDRLTSSEQNIRRMCRKQTLQARSFLAVRAAVEVLRFSKARDAKLPAFVVLEHGTHSLQMYEGRNPT